MRPNFYLVKATVSGALGGLLFGFDTAVIAGAIDALTRLYHLSDTTQGITVFTAVAGTVVGAMSAGAIGQKLGGRETLLDGRRQMVGRTCYQGHEQIERLEDVLDRVRHLGPNIDIENMRHNRNLRLGSKAA